MNSGTRVMRWIVMNRVCFFRHKKNVCFCLFLFCNIFICLAKPRDAEDAVLRGRPLDLKTEVTKIWLDSSFIKLPGASDWFNLKRAKHQMSWIKHAVFTASEVSATLYPSRQRYSPFFRNAVFDSFKMLSLCSRFANVWPCIVSMSVYNLYNLQILNELGHQPTCRAARMAGTPHLAYATHASHMHCTCHVCSNVCNRVLWCSLLVQGSMSRSVLFRSAEIRGKNGLERLADLGLSRISKFQTKKTLARPPSSTFFYSKHKIFFIGRSFAVLHYGEFECIFECQVFRPSKLDLLRTPCFLVQTWIWFKWHRLLRYEIFNWGYLQERVCTFDDRRTVLFPYVSIVLTWVKRFYPLWNSLRKSMISEDSNMT